jgi:alpha-galactosidase
MLNDLDVQIRRHRRRRGAARSVIAAAVAAALAIGYWAVNVGPAEALANGIARTPPMGWNNYPGYRLKIAETLIRQTADKIVSSGMKAAGYTYVNIDDGWMASTRDSNGNLRVDTAKFPSGMKTVADYVHSKGLKLGIYADAGLKTCGGLPGSLGHEKADAKLFASWGIDYLKYDNCYAGPGCANSTCGSTKVPALTRYTAMHNAIVASGRNILLSICNWGQDDVPKWGANVGNMWRTTTDMNNTYARMLSIYRKNVTLAAYAGPGGWNDPDMLETGNGMTATEDRAMMSLWAEMAAPLISGSRLTTASATTLSILLNKNVIAVDQDSLGKQGKRVASSAGLDVLAKPLANGDVSVVLFNSTDKAATISTTLTAIGKSGTASRSLVDLWSGARSTTTGTIRASVPAHGVMMYRVHG